MNATTLRHGRRRAVALLGSTLLASALVVSGCASATPADTASSTAPPSSGTPSATETSASPSPSASESSPAGQTLAVSVTGSKVTPAPSTVDLPVGQTLTLTVTSDHADEVHAHGFEVEKEIEAGGSATLVLTGKDPGVYEVEMHHPALLLLKIAVS